MDIMSMALFAIALCAVAFAARPHAYALFTCAFAGVKAGNLVEQGTGLSSLVAVTCPRFATVKPGVPVFVDRTRTTSDVVSHLGRPLS